MPTPPTQIEEVKNDHDRPKGVNNWLACTGLHEVMPRSYNRSKGFSSSHETEEIADGGGAKEGLQCCVGCQQQCAVRRKKEKFVMHRDASIRFKLTSFLLCRPRENHIMCKPMMPCLLIALSFILTIERNIHADELAFFSEATLADSLRATVATGVEGSKRKEGAKRIRFATMNVQAIKAMDSGHVILNMFPDKAFRVELELVSDRSTRHVTHYLWVGKVVGAPDSDVRVSIWGENMFTSVRIETVLFESEPIDARHAIVRELDMTAFRGEGENDGVDPVTWERME